MLFTLKSQLNSIRCCTPALAAVLSLQGRALFEIQVVQEQSPGSFPRGCRARAGRAWLEAGQVPLQFSVS